MRNDNLHYRKLALFSLLIILLSGCGKPPERTIDPTLSVVRVAVSPALRPLHPALVTCGEEQPGVQLLINEAPDESMPVETDNLSLSLGEPENFEGFAAPIATERLALAVQENSPVISLTTDQLKGLFAGLRQASPLQVWVYPADSRLYEIVHQNALAGGSITSQAFIAPDPAAMHFALLKDPQAIGFLPASWIKDGLREVSLEDGNGPNLEIPVLALASADLEGPARTLVACLQSGKGQELIKEIYP